VEAVDVAHGEEEEYFQAEIKDKGARIYLPTYQHIYQHTDQHLPYLPYHRKRKERKRLLIMARWFPSMML
jgi:hypothetical protein